MRRPRPRWQRASLALLALTVGWLGLVALSIAFYAGTSADGPADAAIVLGASVADGEPTPVFEQRILHAVDLYRDGTVPALILTGGVGAGDVLAESEVARAYCIARGVPAHALSIETESRTTHQNLIQARRLAAGLGARRVLVVSDPLHERRAVTMGRDLGLDAHPSPTPTSRYVGVVARGRFLARETYFYARYLLGRT